MAERSYHMVELTGTEWTRHAVIVRDDGARFEAHRRLGAFGPLIRRICVDRLSGETVRLPIDVWDAEYARIIAATGKALRLEGARIEGELSIDDLGSTG